MSEHSKRSANNQLGIPNPVSIRNQNNPMYAMKLSDLKPPKAPIEVHEWTCVCGALNKGKICVGCGTKKPQELMVWQCISCGWKPMDQSAPPKFCINCGDPFTEDDHL